MHTKKKTCLTLSMNILEFLEIPDEELEVGYMFPVFKKSKNEIIERVLIYVDENKLKDDDCLIHLDDRMKNILLNMKNKRTTITENELVNMLDIHAIYMNL